MDNETQQKPEALPPANGWPGLFLYLGEAVFRFVGYAFFMLAGGGIVAKANLFGVLVVLCLGHMSISMAMVIDQMEREKDSDSDNTGNQPAKLG
ncbi:hypothetical protein [Geminisphaera colitermitum]|uniref:hypothetical protein n=1 Tax=Geminisphaera colitermitum TaxID=1148786 RepID=UPI0001964E65|nr:hypothetical protein [Geminisphaera colitermitum]